MYGGPAEQARLANAASFKDRREDVDGELRRAWAGVEIKAYEVNAEDAEGAYVERMSLVIPAGAPTLQDKSFWMFAPVTGDLDRLPLGKRKTAVQYPYPLTLRYEATVTGTLPSAELPSAQKLSGAGWMVESSFKREGDAIRGVWMAERSYLRFEPAAFGDLKQFWSAATKAAAPGLWLPN
jgi:hypothetical protein